MSVHEAKINWQQHPHKSETSTYSRTHQVELSGNQCLDVSASEELKGDPNYADPEQMLVSALSSCHMLFFLPSLNFRASLLNRIEMIRRDTWRKTTGVAWKLPVLRSHPG
jgi:organic hydroperoxide reductase OsmC/OhrA